MKIEWKQPTDAAALVALAAEEPAAKQRDRYRAVLLAGRGLGD